MIRNTARIGSILADAAIIMTVLVATAQPTSAAVPADVSAGIATTWDGEVSGLPNARLLYARLLYAGMSVYDVDCMLAGSIDCGWEIAFALRDGAFCAIGLIGVGKAVTAWRLKKRLQSWARPRRLKMRAAERSCSA